METLERINDKDVAIKGLVGVLAELEPVYCPLIHIFTKGLYTRKIFMPAFTINSKGETVQTVVVSKIHKTQHPFSILKGKAAVYNKVDDFLGVIEAPYTNITEAGTQRVLQILADCVWITTHPLDYITGEENSWDEERKAELLTRIENDLIDNTMEAVA